MARRRRKAPVAEEAADTILSGLAATVGQVDLPPVTTYLSTGCTLLDLALANRVPGGFPGGRVSHVFGMESTAKSVLALEPLGHAQAQGGKAIYLDAEGSCDFSRLHLFGVDCNAEPNVETDTWCYGVPASIEELFDGYIERLCDELDPSVPNALAVDSLTALGCVTESERKLGDATYGTDRAKMMSMAFRKYLKPLADANLAVIFVDQSRDNITGYGPKEVVSGGKALKFYSSCRVNMRIKSRVMNKSKVVIGVDFEANVIKNKIAPPMRVALMRLLFDYGIDDIGSSLLWLQDHVDSGAVDSVIFHCSDCGKELSLKKTVKRKQCPECATRMKRKRGGGQYQVGGQSFTYLHQAITHVETGGLEAELVKEVVVAWQEAHRGQDRTEKVRINR